MASRKSHEERVLEYFKTAPLESATVVFNLAKSEIKARHAEAGEPATRTPVKRKKRKSTGAASSTTDSAAAS